MSSSANKTNVNDASEIDLSRLVGELIDHRKLIISVTSLFTLIAIIYALFATPIYQADALVQVEQKQANAILSNISQMLPDSQPQSAPEIALLQSRMILGKTVDDLNLQTEIQQNYLPLIGRGIARITGEKSGEVSISHLNMPLSENNDQPIELTLKVLGDNRYLLSGDDFSINGKVGELVDGKAISIKIDKINADVGTEFTISYISKLQAITELQKYLNVTDQGKDTGILNVSLIGDDASLIKKTVDSITNNYLTQNIARQAAQDEKSLEFLDNQLPKVRNELDLAEDKLNAFRKKNDSVDLSLEAKSVLDQIVNVDNQLNELTFRESEISQLYTKEHPTYKALMEKRKTLQDEKAKLNKRVSAMPETQQDILRLSRDVESGRAVYMQLLNRQQELNIAKSSAIGNVRIIDEAVTQPKPVKPNKILVVLIGVILGGVVSVGLVLVPNAGKTFVSSNLAAVIAQTGKKVLYIDVDMRKGYTHRLFNVSNDNGLSDILSGKIEISKAIKKIDSIGFDFISRGMVPPNPAELLMHRHFGEVINWASSHYDIVVLDTPPILAVTDAAIIGNYVGTTLLIARFEQNTAKEIEISVKRFEHSGVSVKGCILNGVVKKASNYYSYGYSSYGYSYTDEK